MRRQAQTRSPSVPIEEFPPGARTALAVLLNAWDLARQMGRDPWDFAEEMSRLWAAGVSNGDLRALLLKGLIAHAQETSTLKSSARTFRTIDNLFLPERSCFVLTKNGESLARTFDPPRVFRASNPQGTRLHGNGHMHLPGLLPEWHADLKELWVGETLVKHFLRPAANQEIVLVALQEQHWAPRIDDPLPRLADRDAKLCLHDTINHLNRNLLESLIHFSGDGTGGGIRWKFTGNVLAPEWRQNGSCLSKKAKE